MEVFFPPNAQMMKIFEVLRIYITVRFKEIWRSHLSVRLNLLFACRNDIFFREVFFVLKGRSGADLKIYLRLLFSLKRTEMAKMRLLAIWIDQK